MTEDEARAELAGLRRAVNAALARGVNPVRLDARVAALEATLRESEKPGLMTVYVDPKIYDFSG